MNKTPLIAAFLLVLTGCTHYYYIPATQNVPLFKEKNEYRASVSTGGGNEINTTDIQAAYSITDRFAVMSNFMLGKGGEKSSTNWGRGTYLDAAFGYFKPLETYGVFEIFGGVGGSQQHHQYQLSSTSYKATSDLSFTKIFIQPSIGLTFSGLDLALTTAFSAVTFHKISNRTDSHDDEYDAVENISAHRTSFLFEPSLTLRGGWKYGKLQLQILSSENFSHSNVRFEKLKVSLGFTFAFAQRFRKKNPTGSGK